MKSKTWIRIVFGAASLFSLFAVPAAAQLYKPAPLEVQSSLFIEEFKQLVASRPQSTAADLIEPANQLLNKSGLNYEIYFDPATCEKIKKVRQQAKDPNASLRLGGTLTSIGGEAATLSLPTARFSAGDCSCFMVLPLLQLTTADFITIIKGRNIRFALPSNFSATAALLVDAKDNSAIKKRWALPERMQPIGISFEENVVYLEFREPELRDFSLAVFDEGLFQIATRAEAETGGKGVAVKQATAQPAAELTRFDRWGKTYVVSTPKGCTP
jgi:hypothetical protein